MLRNNILNPNFLALGLGGMWVILRIILRVSAKNIGPDSDLSSNNRKYCAIFPYVVSHYDPIRLLI